MDNTGESPKLTLSASVMYKVCDTLPWLTYNVNCMSDKNILIHVAIPTTVKTSVLYWVFAPCNTVTVTEEKYCVLNGHYWDQPTAIEFMNRKRLNGRNDFTAAAKQIAL